MTDELQEVTLDILVRNEDFVEAFDLLEVWRSDSTQAGPYVELTSDQWRSARVPSLGGDQPSAPVAGQYVNIVGKVLSLLLRGSSIGSSAQLDITLAGLDPQTLQAVAAQVIAAGLGRVRAYVDQAGLFVLETTNVGRSASLEVLPSDAAVILALPTQRPDSLAYGREARIQLVPGTTLYSLVDVSSSPAFFYKTRFRNRLTNAVSDFSLPFGLGQTAGISPPNLVVGFLDLVTNDGRPLQGREVSVRSPFNGTVIEGKLVAGTDLLGTTDSNGRVQFTLVRGQMYTIAIAGTDIVKEVIAPVDSSTTSFSLVDPNFTDQDDYFAVRVPNIPTLERGHI